MIFLNSCIFIIILHGIKVYIFKISKVHIDYIDEEIVTKESYIPLTAESAPCINEEPV